MENQDKLVGRLRLDLEQLKRDGSKANEILKSIQDVNVNPIDVNGGKEAIKLLRLIQDEFKKLGTNSGVKFDTKSLDEMENKLKGFGVELQETVTKTTLEVTRNNDKQIKSTKELLETIDELGKKRAKILTTTYTYDSPNDIQPSKSNTITKDITSLENDKLLKARLKQEQDYNDLWQKLIKDKEIKELEIVKKKKIAEEKHAKDYEQWWLKSLKTKELQEEKITKKQQLADEKAAKSYEQVWEKLLKNKQLSEEKLNDKTQDKLDISLQNQKKKLLSDELAQSKAINKELENQYKEKLRINDAQEKINLAALKQYTTEQATANRGINNKTLSESMSEISGVSKNQTLGSGDARNSTFSQRFNVAKDYVISSKIFNTAFNSINQAYDAVKNYETGLVDLSRTLDGVTNKDLKEYGAQAIKFAKDFGVPISEVQAAMSELSKAGVQNKDDLMSMTKTILTGVNTTEIKNSAEMTNYLVSTIKQLGLEFKDSEKIIDSWNLLADRYAVQSDDFAQAIAKAGSSSKNLGVDLNDLNAMVVVLGESTGKSGNEIGNALKTMENNILRPETVKTLEYLGVNVMKDAEHFNSLQEIMAQVNQKMDEFGEGSVKANELMSSIGGAWRRNDIQVLANGWDQINKISQESMNSSGYSIKENEKAMSTMQKQVISLKSSLDELFISFGDSGVLDSLKVVISTAKGIVSVMSAIPEPIKKWLVILTEVAVAYKGINAMTKLISGQNIKQLIDPMLSSLPIFNKFIGEGTAQTRAFGSATQALMEQLKAGNISAKESAVILEEVGQQLGMSKSSVDKLAAARGILDAKLSSGQITQKQYNSELKNMTVQTKSAESGTKAYAAANSALGASQKSARASTLALTAASMGMQIAISLGISAVIGIISKVTTASKKLKEFNKELSDSVSKTLDVAKTAEASLSRKKEIEGLLKGNVAVEDRIELEKELYDIKVKIGELLPGAIENLNKEGKAIAENNELIQTQIDLTKEKAKQDANKYLAENSKSKLFAMNTEDNIGQAERDVKLYAEMQEAMKLGQTELVRYIGKNYDGKDITQTVKLSEDALTKLKIKIEENKVSLLEWNMMYSQASDEMKKKYKSYDYVVDMINTAMGVTKDESKAESENTKITQENTDIKKENALSAEEQIKALEELNKAFDTSSSKIADYNKFLSELDENHQNSSDSLQTMFKSYPELLNYINDETGMRSKLKDLIAKETAENQRMFNEKLKMSRESMTQEERDRIDAANAKLAVDEEYYNKTILGNQKVLDKYKDIYGVDLKNYKNLATAKLDVEKKLLKTISDAWAKYYSALGEVMKANTKLTEQANGDIYGEDGSDVLRAQRLLNRQASSTKAGREALEEVKKTQDLLNGLSADFDSIGASFGSIKLDDTFKDKSNSSSSKSDSSQISTIDKATTYSSIINTQNNLLEIQADKVSMVKDKISELVDQENYTDAIRQQNNLYTEQKKQLDLLNSTRTKYMSTENDISKAFNSKGWFKGQDLNKLTQADFDTMYDKLFSGTRNFGTGEQAEKNKKTFEDNANLFKELTSEWFRMKDAVSSTDKAIYDVGKSMSNIVKDIEELENKALDIVEDTQNKIIDLINKGVEQKKKALDKEYDDKKRALQKEKDLYNEQNNTDDYNKNLSREQAKLNDLNNKIANASRDNSLAGQAKMRDLRQQAEEQQATIDKMILDRTRDVNNTRFDDQAKLLDDQHKSSMDSLEELYSEEKVKAMAQTAILTGYFKDVNNSIVDVKTEFGKFEDELGTGITLIANKVKNEFTAALKEAQKTLKDMSTISLSVNTAKDKLPSYAVGTTRLLKDQVAQVHKNEAILPASMNPFLGGKSLDNFMTNVVPTFKVPSFSMPNLSGMSGGKSLEVHFDQPLIAVSGDVSEGMIPTLKDLGASIKGMVTEVLIDEFHNQGIPMH